MSNECRMTPEQWTALVEMFDARGYEWAVEARAKARRLLVEPEQAEIHDGPCRGGPLDGSSMAWGADVFKSWGGEYQWIELTGGWVWFDADPDLTTFGELERGEWFEWDGMPMIVLRNDIEGSLNCASLDRGLLWQLRGFDTVRRLPKPEWSK